MASLAKIAARLATKSERSPNSTKNAQVYDPGIFLLYPLCFAVALDICPDLLYYVNTYSHIDKGVDKMRVTQQDIAKFAQVSQATVSRVLAGDDRVESHIKSRVLQVMREHNYQPDVRARSLRQRRTHLIGLVMKREVGTLQGDPFFAQFVSEIIDTLAGTPFHLCVDIAANQADQEFVYDELLRTRRVDGLVLVESEPSDSRISRLQEDDFPFVLIGNTGGNDNLWAIDNDNIAAAEIATRHLLERGYRAPLFLAGPRELTVTRDREEGYRKTMEAFGLRAQVAYTAFGMDPARERAEEVLNRESSPDSILAMDDLMAMAVVQAARNTKRRVPETLGLVGFNNSPVCELIEGGLTSVDLNIPKMVRWSVSQLLARIESKEPLPAQRKTMSAELVVRGSSPGFEKMVTPR